MSFTLNKLKQSEVDHGYRKPFVKKKLSSSYGIFIACFAITLALLLALIIRGQDHFSQTQPTTVKQATEDMLDKDTTLVQYPEKRIEAKTKENDITEGDGNEESPHTKINGPIPHTQEENASIEKQISVDGGQSGSAKNQPVLWQDLPSSYQKSLPEMEFNGIVFFEDVEDRFIFINMKKYGVDDVVETGPSIAEIRIDSAVMDYKNRRFILPLNK